VCTTHIRERPIDSTDDECYDNQGLDGLHYQARECTAGTACPDHDPGGTAMHNDYRMCYGRN
jgi:hypothetical protein